MTEELADMHLKWSFPYPSQRMPVFAGNVVATSQPLAAQAGLLMLRKGGNAVDAALAAAIALTVVEPTSNGIGGDAFAMVWDGNRLHGLNGSGRSPMLMSRKRFRHLREIPMLGWDPVTVPGAVDAWQQLSNRFGRLPFADLFPPAVAYARDGFPVSPLTAERWLHAETDYQDFPSFGETFLPSGSAPRTGEMFRCPDQARTLEEIAVSSGEAFYRGDLARTIVRASKAGGGLLRLSDFENHRSEWVEPITIRYRGRMVHELPPNGQGIAALIALKLMRYHDTHRLPPDTADSLHLQIEAMKIALSETRRCLADPVQMTIKPDQLLAEDFLSVLADKIQPNRAGFPESGPRPGAGTVYLASADDSGMMVSFIQSNYLGFGSGIVVPGTGISLQNRGYGFVLEKHHPNCVEGGKRPYHTIIPGFVTHNGRPLLAFGVMGGHMQPQGHVQLITRIFDHQQNPQAACDAPRWYIDTDNRIALEPGFAPAILSELRRRGHRFMQDVPPTIFGGAQLVYCLPTGYCAASDHRKDGQAVGF
jgi:gamma-glutamyltranspeptidase/glutathione hydrolase